MVNISSMGQSFYFQVDSLSHHFIQRASDLVDAEKRDQKFINIVVLLYTISDAYAFMYVRLGSLMLFFFLTHT